MERVMMITKNVEEVSGKHSASRFTVPESISGPYNKKEIGFWIQRCEGEHAMSSLTRELRPLTKEEEALPTSTHMMGASL